MPNFTISFTAMGSTINIWLNAPTEADAQPLAKIPQLFEAWEQRFSRFRPTSELSQLNARAGEWVLLSGPMAEVVSLALKAARMTDGIFNPLILDALEATGYDHTFDDPASFVPSAATNAVQVPDYRKTEFEEDTSTMRLPKGSRLDLGGIVKGWAAQRTADYLSSFGACLVDAGGDIVARGSPDASGGWIASVPNPQNGQLIGSVLLKDAAIATSGKDYRRWQRDGQDLHHLIDPRTGQPAQNKVLSATVIAESGVKAEVWAKVSLITGVLPDLAALLVDQDGSIHTNSHFDRMNLEKVS